MENENKNPSAPQGDKKKNNNRRKPHKTKSYFMTPVEASSKSESKEKNVNNTQGNVAQSNANQNNSQKNQFNKNKKKHRKNNDRPRDNANSKKESQDKSNETLTPMPTSTASKSDRLEMPITSFSASPENQKYADYDEFSYEEIYGPKEEVSESIKVTENEDGSALSLSADSDNDDPTVEVVGIKFKESGKTYYFAPGEIKLHVGQHAIVKTSRGLEYGEVAIANTMVKESETVPPLRSVARIATDADIKHHAENKEKEDMAFRVCNEKIISHNLDMKLIDAQYTFDNSKLLFYFTSSGRVDFRDLVKDLASVFRTRIELRQIGIRDEAKMIGGLGLCGRPLCCSLFLTDFGQVSIKMAKEQNLSLNSSKISGICGRLMCCLRYEQETYDYEIKHTPPVDTVVKTVDGIGTVTEISPLAGTIKVRLNSHPDVPPKSYKREDVSILKKKH